MIALALLATGLPAAPARPAPLDAEIARIEARMSPGGWTPLTPPARVDIRAKAVGAYSYPFAAGQSVAAVATCGGACAEVRLDLSGPDGARLARAYEGADGWALEAEVQETGDHRLTVSAEGCGDPCRVGVLIFVRWAD